MLNRIIRILATTLGALLIAAGCSKAPYDPASEQKPIRFDAGSALLRSDATRSVAYYDNTSFGVFTFKQSGGTWAQLTSKHWKPSYMFNQEVHYQSGVYTYSPLRFWPDPADGTLTFWAYSPYDADADLLVAGSTTTAYTSNSEGLPDMRVTVDGHTDVLYSDVLADQTYTSNSGVANITFNHALSLIDVYVQKIDDPDDDYTVTLNSVSFNGIYMTGILKSSDWSWYSHSGARQNLLLWENDPDDASDDAIAQLENGVSHSIGSLMPLPQSLSSDLARLQIVFTLSSPSLQTPRTTTRNVLLRETLPSNLTEWEGNSHYTLTIKISADRPIEFTVTWSDWGADHNYHLSS